MVTVMDMDEAQKTALARIRLVAFDVDGVLTDGRLYYSGDGEMKKVFHVRDGVGLKLLPDMGIDVAVISAKDSPPLQARLSDLGIKYGFPGCHDKLACLKTLVSTLGLIPDEVAFVGDDLVDLHVMEWCGYGIAPADAFDLVLERADLVLPVKGGQGVARCVADLVLKAQGLYETAYNVASLPHFERQRSPDSP
jgi:3-deoxy-D-manno-octulosonate 8-phosphate phosphatase (KDO 8-P phosphatase)